MAAEYPAKLYRMLQVHLPTFPPPKYFSKMAKEHIYKLSLEMERIGFPPERSLKQSPKVALEKSAGQISELRRLL